jgi:hypothetical protein
LVVLFVVGRVVAPHRAEHLDPLARELTEGGEVLGSSPSDCSRPSATRYEMWVKVSQPTERSQEEPPPHPPKVLFVTRT